MMAGMRIEAPMRSRSDIRSLIDRFLGFALFGSLRTKAMTTTENAPTGRLETC